MIKVVQGDIAKVPVDAIAALLNPEGEWFGAIDTVIKNAAGSLYHDQARELLDMGHFTNGSAFLARGSRQQHTGVHPGQFDHVIFCCDDVRQPLPTDLLVMTVLAVALEEGLESVALPVFRTGTAAHHFPDIEETIRDIVAAVLDFNDASPEIDITFVVYNDPRAVKMLKAGLE